MRTAPCAAEEVTGVDMRQPLVPPPRRESKPSVIELALVAMLLVCVGFIALTAVGG